MTAAAPDRRRQTPATAEVLAAPALAAALERWARPVVVAAIHAAQEDARAGRIPAADVAAAAVAHLPARPTTMRPVINATGVVVHTNLGRAPLSGAALDAVVAAAGYADVEYGVEHGRRSTRGAGARAALLAALPGAGDVHVVNNGAAALLLALTVLAAGREVVWSRGELVEIGDGFRLPDLAVTTGARIREVGTTNRTTLDDYAAAVGPGTGCILKVHPSNFVVSGFASSVGVGALCGLGVPVVVDVGSGLLAADRMLPDEPDVASALAAGASVVTASGDKLFGGPQFGLAAGTAPVVGALRRHPLARALRVDKLTLAAIEGTLLGPPPPVSVSLHAAAPALRERCAAVAAAVGGQVVESAGAVGGGGGPGVELPGWAVALPAELATPLRLGDPCVVGRVADGRLLLDLRCVPPGSDRAVVEAVRAAAAAVGAAPCT